MASNTQNVGPDTALTILSIECVSCQLNCLRITRRPERGVPPRGFSLAGGRVGEKVLMAVFGEPGSISPHLDGTDTGDHQLERRRYQRAINAGGMAALAQEQAAVTEESFRGGRSTFHKRTMGLLRDIFGSGERAFKLTYFTNLTKCEKEYAPPPIQDWQIPVTTRRTCADLYLKREVEIVKPKAVLAFGNAGRFIDVLGIDRTLPIDHPMHRKEGPSWLHGSDRQALLLSVRRLTGDGKGLMR